MRWPGGGLGIVVSETDRGDRRGPPCRQSVRGPNAAWPPGRCRGKPLRASCRAGRLVRACGTARTRASSPCRPATRRRCRGPRASSASDWAATRKIAGVVKILRASAAGSRWDASLSRTSSPAARSTSAWLPSTTAPSSGLRVVELLAHQLAEAGALGGFQRWWPPESGAALPPMRGVSVASCVRPLLDGASPQTPAGH